RASVRPEPGGARVLRSLPSGRLAHRRPARLRRPGSRRTRTEASRGADRSGLLHGPGGGGGDGPAGGGSEELCEGPRAQGRARRDRAAAPAAAIPAPDRPSGGRGGRPGPGLAALDDRGIDLGSGDGRARGPTSPEPAFIDPSLIHFLESTRHPVAPAPAAAASVPDGIRTRVTGLKGQRPGPLDDGDSHGRRRLTRSRVRTPVRMAPERYFFC